MKLNADGSSSSGEVNSEVVIQPQPIGEFQGVLAEKMIIAEELWREILKFLCWVGILDLLGIGLGVF